MNKEIGKSLKIELSKYIFSIYFGAILHRGKIKYFQEKNADLIKKIRKIMETDKTDKWLLHYIVLTIKFEHKFHKKFADEMLEKKEKFNESLELKKIENETYAYFCKLLIRKEEFDLHDDFESIDIYKAAAIKVGIFSNVFTNDDIYFLIRHIINDKGQLVNEDI